MQHAATNITPNDIAKFWRDAGPEKWYKQSDEFDAEIRDRFQNIWETARAGALDHWQETADGAFALLILTDQFPRNMFRGDARAFATDDLARNIARHAVDQGWDLQTTEPERQFFYMPFMHSESPDDHDDCVRLVADRMQNRDTLLHAQVHREIIRRFNRFPYRNDALGRTTTEAEHRFLNEEGGYAAIVQNLKSQEK